MIQSHPIVSPKDFPTPPRLPKVFLGGCLVIPTFYSTTVQCEVTPTKPSASEADTLKNEYYQGGLPAGEETDSAGGQRWSRRGEQHRILVLSSWALTNIF